MMKKNKLHNIKSTGFKIPDNYFESFDNKLFGRIGEKESIEGIETHGYKVPENYFDSVETKVFSKLNTEDKPVVSLQSRKTFYYIAGIAAFLVLLVAVFFNTTATEEALSAEMVEAYLENRDFDSYELAQLLSDVDLLEDDFTITQTTFNAENLETYLIDNADIETIFEY